MIRQTNGIYTGIDAVIDKDRASALLAEEIGAEALLMLTDVDDVYLGWGTSKRNLINRTTPAEMRRQEFASGSMGPKVEAAAAFVDAGSGQLAGIGMLQDALAILEGRAGTLVTVLDN